MCASGSFINLVECLKSTEIRLAELIECLPPTGNVANLRDALFYAMLMTRRCGKRTRFTQSGKSRSARNMRALQRKFENASQLDLLVPHNHFVFPELHAGSNKTILSVRDWDKLLLSRFRKEKSKGLKDDFQRSVLHFAAFYGSAALVKQLLNSGVSIREDRLGLSPVMWACYADRLDNLCVLDEYLKTINQVSWMYAPDCNGWTPIHYALRSKNGSECFEHVMQQYGAISVDNIGRTVLHHAVLLGKLRLCKLIMKYTDPSILDVTDQFKRTALHLATAGGHGDIVAFLLAHHANPELLDQHGHSPVAYAQIQRLNLCMLLLSKHRRSSAIVSTDQVPNSRIDPIGSAFPRTQAVANGSSIGRQEHLSSLGSSSESINLSADFMQPDIPSGPSFTEQARPSNGTQWMNHGNYDGEMHFKENVLSPGSIRSSMYLASNNNHLYRTRENLAIHDEEEQNNVAPFARPASPIPPPMALIRRARRVQTAQLSSSNPSSLSTRLNGSTANKTTNLRTKTSGNTRSNTLTHTTNVCNFIPSQGEPRWCTAVPPQPKLLVAKPTTCYSSRLEHSRPGSGREMEPVENANATRERVRACEAPAEGPSSSSDVDRGCEVPRVIRIPARLYRASGRCVYRAQSVQNPAAGGDRKSNQVNVGKSSFHGPSRTSSCSSISEQDNPLNRQETSNNPEPHNHQVNAMNVNGLDRWTISPEVDENTADSSRHSTQSSRLLKRNQLSRTLGSFKKLFVRREKGVEHEVRGCQPASIQNLSNSEQPDPKTVSNTLSPSRSGTTTSVVYTNPVIKPRLLTPSIDQLTNKHNVRQAKR